MGCDIHLITEIKKDGEWVANKKKIFGHKDYLTDSPFDWRNYSIFSFLAGVRNRDDIEPIFKPRGLPKDSNYIKKKTEDVYGDYYRGYSYITLREFIEFNYEQKATEEETYRQYLLPEFFEELELLKTLGEPDDVRILFWFDN